LPPAIGSVSTGTRRIADKGHHERGGRLVVDLVRLADLLHFSQVEDGKRCGNTNQESQGSATAANSACFDYSARSCKDIGSMCAAANAPQDANEGLMALGGYGVARE
jgi:hypothetical protein